VPGVNCVDHCQTRLERETIPPNVELSMGEGMFSMLFVSCRLPACRVCRRAAASAGRTQAGAVEKRVAGARERKCSTRGCCRCSGSGRRSASPAVDWGATRGVRSSGVVAESHTINWISQGGAHVYDKHAERGMEGPTAKPPCVSVRCIAPMSSCEALVQATSTKLQGCGWEGGWGVIRQRWWVGELKNLKGKALLTVQRGGEQGYSAHLSSTVRLGKCKVARMHPQAGEIPRAPPTLV